MRSKALALFTLLVAVAAAWPLKENPKLVVKLEDGEGHHISLVPVKLKVGPNKATSVEDVKRLLNEPIEQEPSSSSEEMVKIHAVPEERERSREEVKRLDASEQGEKIRN